MGTLDSSGSNTPSQWLIGLVQRLNKAHSFVRERLARAQMRQKRTYDLRVVEKTYDLGDIVYRLDSSTKVGAKALQPIWKGPFVITRCQPPLYKLQGKRASGVWHHDKLKLCQDRDLPLWVQRLRGQVLGGVEEENLESEPSLNLDTLWRKTRPAESGVIDENAQDLQDLQDSGDRLSEEIATPGATRSKRAVRRPGYLRDYTE